MLGTPLSPSAMRVMLLGSGELGKEVAIELQRFGCEVIAVDRYANAPAMQVSQRGHVIDMLDGAALRAAGGARAAAADRAGDRSDRNADAAAAGGRGLRDVIPTARAARLTMDREGIRRLAAEELKLADLALSIRRQRS